MRKAKPSESLRGWASVRPRSACDPIGTLIRHSFATSGEAHSRALRPAVRTLAEPARLAESPPASCTVPCRDGVAGMDKRNSEGKDLAEPPQAHRLGNDERWRHQRVGDPGEKKIMTTYMSATEEP